MTTIGEELWSGLLNRSDEVGEYGKRSDTIQVTIIAGRTKIIGFPEDVKTFRFKPFEVRVDRSGVPCRVFLTFARNNLFSQSAVVRLLIKWPHSFDFVRNQWIAKFYGLKPKTLLRAQLVVLAGPSPVNKPVKVSIILPAGGREPQYVANFAFAHAGLSQKFSHLRRSSRRPPFPRQPKQRASPVIGNSTYVSGSEGPGSPWSQTTVSYESYRRTWSSVSTPGFGKVKRVNLPINPYTLTITRTNLGQGVNFRTAKLFPEQFQNKAVASTSIIDEIPSLPSFDSSLEGRAIRKLAERADVDINNVAQDLVQFRQTTNMIARSATRIASSYSALRKGNFSSAVKSLHNPKGQTYRNRPSHSRDLASNWLELQYGWKPLLQDIDGSMRSLANFLHSSDIVRSVRASSKSESKYRWPIRFANQPIDFGNSSPLSVIGYGDRESLNVVSLGVRFKLDNAMKAFYSQTGFTSPVNLAWELLPYSFVVDWFLPIGPYLESMSYFEGMRFIDGHKTYFVRLRDFAQLSFNGTLPRSPAWNTRLRALYDQEVVVVVREKLVSFPLQQYPQFKNPFSTQHALNAVALLRTAFRQ